MPHLAVEASITSNAITNFSSISGTILHVRLRLKACSQDLFRTNTELSIMLGINFNSRRGNNLLYTMSVRPSSDSIHFYLLHSLVLSKPSKGLSAALCKVPLSPCLIMILGTYSKHATDVDAFTSYATDSGKKGAHLAQAHFIGSFE